MNWQAQTRSEPKVLSGRLVVRGTKLWVDVVLELLAERRTDGQIFEGYSPLTRDARGSFFAFAAETTPEERVVELNG